MSKKSIGTYHATIAATAQPFIDELKRADRESRRATGSIRAEIGGTMRALARDFTLPKLAKGLLSGFGIGGGIQIVGSVMDVFAERWRESEQFAAKLEERAKGIADQMREVSQGWQKIAKENLEPGERRDAINRDIAKLAADKEKAADDRLRALRGFQWVEEYSKKYSGMQIKQFEGEDFTRGGIAIPKREFTDIMGERLDDAQKRWAEADKKMQPLVSAVIALNRELGSAAQTESLEDLTMLVREINLGAGRSPAQVRGEIGPDATQTVAEQWAQIIKDREQAGQEEFDRWARAGAVRVDDMTRRGLGTGADYRSIGEKTNSILSQILDTTRKALSELRTNAPRFAD